MKSNIIRLFEHIKLLQRGVELYQNGIVEKDCASLQRGLSGENIRIGLLGATSAGKTTLIRRLLSDSAGKISSRPETACLVIHTITKAESIVLTLHKTVRFNDEKTSADFREFLRDYDLKDYYSRNGDGKEWTAKESDVTKEWPREEILNFFAQVNKFDNVFDVVKWNHKQRSRDYDLMDLIDIYDLPGFGGKDAHDEAVDSILCNKDFDIIIYLIDTSKGVPDVDEKEPLEEVRRYLNAHRNVVMYWAYEKPSPEKLDVKQSEENISNALQGLGVDFGDDIRLLNLCGEVESIEDDLVQSTILTEVLKPYFVKVAKSYCDSNRTPDKISDRIIQVFSNKEGEGSDGKSSVRKILDGTLKKFMKMEKTSSSDAAKQLAGDLGVADIMSEKVRDKFIGRVISCVKAVWGQHDTKGRPGLDNSNEDHSDRNMALSLMRSRIKNSVQKIIDGISTRRFVDPNKVQGFSSVYNDADDLRTLVYDTQFYLMLQDRDGVRDYFLSKVKGGLGENIQREIEAIEKFSDVEE